MEYLNKNKKYNEILAASKALFWKFGFRKVTIEEICREAKTSKMTFYKHFPNKVEVAKAVLDQVVNNSMNDFTELKNKATSSAELMEGMLKMKKEGIHEISKEFLADFYTDTELGLKEYMASKTMQVFASMIADFKDLQQKGLIRKDLKIEFYLVLAQKIGGLMDDPYLISLFPNPEDLVMEFTNLFAYGMSPRTDKP
jgi:AcrR family transcriptional regulator